VLILDEAERLGLASDTPASPNHVAAPIDRARRCRRRTGRRRRRAAVHCRRADRSATTSTPSLFSARASRISTSTPSKASLRARTRLL